MTPREELLATGQLGPVGAELLYKTVWAVAVGHRFPPPEHATVWRETAVVEIAHDFIDGDRGRKRLTDVTIRSVDDRSFERLLEAAVLNFLRDQGRQTDLGKLIVRVKEILRGEAEFVHVPGQPERWTLSEGPTAPSTAAPDKLASATAGIEVVVPKWTSERRDPPLADRASFVRLMQSVLTAAAGSLTSDDIARTLAARLDHRRVPQTISLDVLEHVAEPAEIGGDPATSMVARLHATDIFNSLSDRERIIVTALDADVSVRDLGRMIGMGKSQAALVRERLIDRLRVELDGEDDPDATAHEMWALCDEWTRRRTRNDDATSEHLRGEERGDGSDD